MVFHRISFRKIPTSYLTEDPQSFVHQLKPHPLAFNRCKNFRHSSPLWWENRLRVPQKPPKTDPKSHLKTWFSRLTGPGPPFCSGRLIRMSPWGIESFWNEGPPRNDPQKDFPKTHLKHLEIVVSLDFGWFLGDSKSIFSSKRIAMPEIFTRIESQWMWLQLRHKRSGVLSQGNSWEFSEKNFYGKSSKNIGKRDFLIDD